MVETFLMGRTQLRKLLAAFRFCSFVAFSTFHLANRSFELIFYEVIRVQISNEQIHGHGIMHCTQIATH